MDRFTHKIWELDHQNGDGHRHSNGLTSSGLHNHDLAISNDLKQVADLSLDGVCMFNLAAKEFVYLNDTFAAMFQLSPESIKADPTVLKPFIHDEDADYLMTQFNELFGKKKMSGVELRIKFKDESIRYLCYDAYLLDNPLRVVAFVKDITMAREHEDYIINYGAKKDTLLDMMSHNLSGPLTLTQNILQWMQKTYTDEASGSIRSQLHMIQENTQECLNIVNDFLKEEHLASESIFVKKTRFNVLERIMNTIDKLIATNKNKHFQIVSAVNDLNISTDSVKFFQIIHNLLSNAIKFTPDNGKIEIILEETSQSFIIRIKDNGIGIPESLQPTLFNRRNMQGRNGLNNEVSNGMGLAIVKNLTDLLGGHLTFHSKENEGTTFSLELPKD